MQRYVTWRIGRKEYGVALATYFAFYFAVHFLVSATLAQMALPVIWVLALAVPRLRDIGWSVWWSLAPFGSGFVVGLAGSIMSRATGQTWPMGNILMVLVGLGSFAFMLVLAFRPPKASPSAEAFT